MDRNQDKDGSDEYEVGYGKPPRENQFKPGQSGNPNGRPRNMSKEPEDTIEAFFSEPVTVTKNGQRVEMTREQTVLQKLYENAMAGDTRSLDILLKHARKRPAGRVRAGEQPKQPSGVLVVPPEMSLEECMEMFGEYNYDRQAKIDGQTYEERVGCVAKERSEETRTEPVSKPAGPRVIR